MKSCQWGGHEGVDEQEALDHLVTAIDSGLGE